MTEQFENPQATKLENETISEESTNKKIAHIAEEAAGKAVKAEQKFDADHSLFSK